MALAMGGTSCKKDSKQNAGERMVIGAGINQGGGNGSKTYVGDLQNGEYPVLWGEGDAFDLFSENGTDPQQFGIEDGVGKTSGKFEGIDPGGSKYFGFYPSGKGTRTDNSTFTYTVEELSNDEDKCQNAPMFGYSADGKNVMFENVMSWVRIGLKTTDGTVHVTSVSLGAKNDEAVMKGTLTVSFEDETITNTAMSGDKHSLTVSTNMTVSTTPQFVSFLVPASTATSWIFTVKASSDTWNSASYEKTISCGIERNAIYVGEIVVANSEGNGGDATYSGAIPGSSDSDDPTTGGGEEGTTAPEGALSGLFSVSADQKVYFSKGNLYADISDDNGTLDGDDPWHFEDEQYYYRDYYGITEDAANLAGDVTTTPEHTVGMFYWSPNTATACSKEWEDFDVDPETEYVFFSNNDDVVLYDNNAWYTLSDPEWEWLLGPGCVSSAFEVPKPGVNCRTSSTVGGVENARFAWVSVNGVPGFLIFPDLFEWKDNMGSAPTNINETYMSPVSICSYTDEQFAKMEEAGCAFLPAAGKRNPTTLSGIRGYYWSASSEHYTSDTHLPALAPIMIQFSCDDGSFSSWMAANCSNAYPVRLVIDAE